MNKIILWTLIIITFNSWAERKVVHESLFLNKNCLKTDSCDLKSFYLKIYQSTETRGSTPDTSNTYMEGFYETSTISMLEEYAVVQFIKGCNYKTTLKDNQIVSKKMIIRDFFGKSNHLFSHPKWVVDSIDYDPIYKSFYEEKARHGAYMVLFDESKSIVYDDRKYYDYYLFNPPMNKPRLYFSDLPTGGSLSKVITPNSGADEGRAIQSFINSSLKFKTCIYKTKDVAIDAGPSGVDIARAIHCFEWKSSHLLNANKTSFVAKETIDPFCASRD